MEIKDQKKVTVLVLYIDEHLPIGGEASFTFPFMTKVKIAILRTFRSCIAVFNLGPPMAFLVYSWYGKPGLASLIDDLFRGLRDFQIASRTGIR